MYAERGRPGDRSRSTHATTRCKPLHSIVHHDQMQRPTTCQSYKSTPCKLHCTSTACERTTRSCRVVSRHAMRAHYSLDLEACLRHRWSAASIKSASPRSFSNTAAGVWWGCARCCAEVAAAAEPQHHFSSRLAECSSQAAHLLHTTFVLTITCGAGLRPATSRAICSFSRKSKSLPWGIAYLAVQRVPHPMA